MNVVEATALVADGDPNAAIDAAEPLVLGPQFGGSGATPAEISVMFVAQAALDAGAGLPGVRRAGSRSTPLATSAPPR